MAIAMVDMPRRTKKSEPTADQPRETAKTDTIRVHSEVAEMVTLVAIRRKISVADLISPVVAAFIQTEYRKEVEKMHQDLGKKKDLKE